MDQRSNQRGMEIGKDCIKIIIDKLSKQSNSDEYYLALLELDKKYPIQESFEPLYKEDYQNYREKGLQPKNFKEAAEMYAWKKRKDENIIKERKIESALDSEKAEEFERKRIEAKEKLKQLN